MERAEPIAVYVHTPFCPTKCGYCDFNSFAMKGAIHEQTVKAIVHEIECSPLRGRPAKTIFFGGGTPTYLKASQLERLLRAVVAAHPPVEGCEITSEANPGTVDIPKFAAMRAMGFNRISMGAQSFVDSDLERLGRVHRSGDIERAFRAAREAGFDNVNLDLMFALPGQSREAWKANLERAIALGPEHLSLYCLTLEANTPFYKEHLRGTLVLPDDDEQVAMYEEAISCSADAGYLQYEISNFAKPGFECRHNLAYWRYEEYAGYGPGAVGASDLGLGDSDFGLAIPDCGMGASDLGLGIADGGLGTTDLGLGITDCGLGEGQESSDRLSEICESAGNSPSSCTGGGGGKGEEVPGTGRHQDREPSAPPSPGSSEHTDPFGKLRAGFPVEEGGGSTPIGSGDLEKEVPGRVRYTNLKHPARYSQVASSLTPSPSHRLTDSSAPPITPVHPVPGSSPAGGAETLRLISSSHHPFTPSPAHPLTPSCPHPSPLWCEWEPLDPQKERLERIMLGIRLNEGLPLTSLSLSESEFSNLKSQIGRLEARGWVEWAGDSVIRLTSEGRHFCSEVALALA